MQQPHTTSNINIYDTIYKDVLDYGPRVISGLIIFFAGLYLIGFLKKRLIGHMSRKEVHSSLQPFFLSLAITALHLILIIVVMEIIGIQLTIFTTVIGAAGVAAGLALSGTLQNFAGGILILLLKPFEIYDNIVAQSIDGMVTSIQLFYTVVLTFDNKTVIIPNGKLFNEVIVNVSREGKRRLDIELKLNYAADVDQVKTIIGQAIAKTSDILPDPATILGVTELDTDGMKIAVKVWVNTNLFLKARYALQENIVKDLKAAGVKLPGMP
jgi:small conductance mechanosensitive channel